MTTNWRRLTYFKSRALSMTIKINYVAALRCLRCGALYDPEILAYVCSCRSNLGSNLGTLDVQYDYAAIEPSAYTRPNCG